MNHFEISREVFAQYRAVAIADGQLKKEITDESLKMALTVNKNLNAFGYTLKPEAIIMLSKCSDINFYYHYILELIGDVKAEPMYPDFPKQVMELDESQFYFNQMCHYFSTYGLRDIFGVEIKKGWLPDVESTPKTVEDEFLLKDKKIIKIYSKSGLCNFILKDVLSKRERMTEAEMDMVMWSLSELPISLIPDFNITFKENMLPLFSKVFNLKEGDVDLNDHMAFVRYKVTILKNICQHTGDVLKMLQEMLDACNWHFSTHQKKIFVYLFEEYSESDFEENLIYSLKNSKQNIKMFEFLSYNRYSKKPGHKKIVARLRNGDLHSWYSKIEKMVQEKYYTGLIRELSNRPGILFRSIARLLRIGVSSKEIYEGLKYNVDKLSMQTLLSTYNSYRAKYGLGLNKVTKTYNGNIDSACHDVIAIINQVIFDRIGKINIDELKGKKVYLDIHDYSLFQSELQVAEKSDEASYVRTGIAYRIPDNIDIVRFFCYWNDEMDSSVDLDLHATALGPDMHSRIGWNAGYKSEELGMCFSGDITHSDAAEYIDVDINKAVGKTKFITLAIDSYSCEPFSEIDTVFCGLQAVNKFEEDVKLYDPKNCFWSHWLNSSARYVDYAYLDLENRLIVFHGNGTVSRGSCRAEDEIISTGFNLGNYISALLAANKVELVENREEAEVVITLGTTSEDNEISLIENNFFMDR